MKLLAIDTATEVCSAALLCNGVLTSEYRETARDHSRLILSMVDGLMDQQNLKPDELDGLAFGRGPGSFTGVRIAAGVAQGIAFAANCPVVPVSDLAAIAQRSWREHEHSNVLVAIDARMSEVYWGAFSVSDGVMKPVLEECVCVPSEVPLPETSTAQTWVGAGTGWNSYGGILQGRCSILEVVEAESRLPHAGDVLELAKGQFAAGEGIAAEFAQPVYLRDKVAKTLVERGINKSS